MPSAGYGRRGTPGSCRPTSIASRWIPLPERASPTGRDPWDPRSARCRSACREEFMAASGGTPRPTAAGTRRSTLAGGLSRHAPPPSPGEATEFSQEIGGFPPSRGERAVEGPPQGGVASLPRTEDTRILGVQQACKVTTPRPEVNCAALERPVAGGRARQPWPPRRGGRGPTRVNVRGPRGERPPAGPRCPHVPPAWTGEARGGALRPGLEAGAPGATGAERAWAARVAPAWRPPRTRSRRPPPGGDAALGPGYWAARTRAGRVDRTVLMRRSTPPAGCHCRFTISRQVSVFQKYHARRALWRLSSPRLLGGAPAACPVLPVARATLDRRT